MFFGVESPVCIDIIGISQEVVEAFTLLGGIAGHLVFAFGVVDIDGVMGTVQVPCQNYSFTRRFQAFDVIEKVGVPFLSPVGQPSQAFSSIRSVTRDQVELLKLKRQHPTLAIMLADAKVMLYADGPDFGEDGNTRIPFLVLAAIPVLLVVPWYFSPSLLFDNSIWVCFGFIQADDVWICLGNEFLELVLIDGSVYAIYVPGVNRCLLVTVGEVFVLCATPFRSWHYLFRMGCAQAEWQGLLLFEDFLRFWWGFLAAGVVWSLVAIIEAQIGLYVRRRFIASYLLEASLSILLLH